jgi:hypothetical protein
MLLLRQAPPIATASPPRQGHLHQTTPIAIQHSRVTSFTQLLLRRDRGTTRRWPRGGVVCNWLPVKSREPWHGSRLGEDRISTGKRAALSRDALTVNCRSPAQRHRSPVSVAAGSAWARSGVSLGPGPLPSRHLLDLGLQLGRHLPGQGADLGHTAVAGLGCGHAKAGPMPGCHHLEEGSLEAGPVHLGQPSKVGILTAVGILLGVLGGQPSAGEPALQLL